MLLPLFLMSCLNKDNNIVSLLKEWEQKEILFPKEMYFTTMLRDTTYYNLQSEYKISQLYTLMYQKSKFSNS